MRCSKAKVAMIGHCSFLCTGVFHLAALKQCGPLKHRTDNYGLVRMPAQESSSDAESRKFSDQPVKKVDPGRNDPSGNPELSIWLIYGGKSVDDRGPSRSCTLVRDFYSRWTRALRIAARHIRLHPAPCRNLDRFCRNGNRNS